MGIELKQGTQENGIREPFRLQGDVTNNSALYVDGQGGSATSGTKVTTDYYFQVTRATPPGSTMGFLPRGAVPVSLQYFSPTTSNSASTSQLTIGVDTTTNYFLTGTDVKGSTGLGVQTPTPPSILNTLFVQLDQSTSHALLAGYSETGTSTSGGPWSCCISYYVP